MSKSKLACHLIPAAVRVPGGPAYAGARQRLYPGAGVFVRQAMSGIRTRLPALRRAQTERAGGIAILRVNRLPKNWKPIRGAHCLTQNVTGQFPADDWGGVTESGRCRRWREGSPYRPARHAEAIPIRTMARAISIQFWMVTPTMMNCSVSQLALDPCMLMRLPLGHETDLPTVGRDVRSRGQSRRAGKEPPLPSLTQTGNDRGPLSPLKNKRAGAI